MGNLESVLSKELCKFIKAGHTQSECVAFIEGFKLAFNKSEEVPLSKITLAKKVID